MAEVSIMHERVMQTTEGESLTNTKQIEKYLEASNRQSRRGVTMELDRGI
jgi:16S rRNA U1498 N3-methylase RsmE